MATRKKALTRGEKVCAFIEKYCLAPEGEHIGKPILLQPFQRKFVLEVYDSPVGTHTAILSIGRKNGKTGLAAGLALCHLAGPEAERRGEVYSAANDKEQAGKTFAEMFGGTGAADSSRGIEIKQITPIKNNRFRNEVLPFNSSLAASPL